MTHNQVQYVINRFVKEVANLQGHETYAEFLYDSDMGIFIVNIKVNRIFPMSDTEDICYDIAKCVERILSVYLPEKGMEWHLYSEPNYWGKDGEELGDMEDLKPGDIIQWCIYKEMVK